ncbi:MAG: hypothetical protein BWY74_02149 [Firmicutes bacterium ADurb.Bin419]|nr:MAG: hypothetical protein BWY74_02149 [Firmicutes bacterium ADurb.Bin419]
MLNIVEIMNGRDKLDKVKKHLSTELSEKDRKILDKYTKFYSNFIESNTAKTELHDDKRFKASR